MNLSLPSLWSQTQTFLTSLSLFNLTFQSSPSVHGSLDALNKTIGGRLLPGQPFVIPCAHHPESDECKLIQKGYLDSVFRSTAPGGSGYINTQWETCQSTGEGCLLDHTNPLDLSTVSKQKGGCGMGSVSEYYIDVRSYKDVEAAFRFGKELKEFGMPIVIKNTGHDYKGRSSAPGSLALWTHNLKDITLNSAFQAEGCSPATSEKTYTAVTMGAGVQWHEAYEFAEEHNITLVGGSDKAVGSVGGWLQGGGHGLLSNTLGLGVDRALQFKVVTPRGEYLTANACQNQDLFFALRGGGGGTFGLVLESTILASSRLTIQAAFVHLPAPDPSRLWGTMTSHAPFWASEGWGGISTSDIAIYVNPRLSSEQAKKSMEPLLKLKENSEGVVTQMMEFPSYFKFFDWFANANVAAAGLPLALSSLLVPTSALTRSEKSREKVVEALAKASEVAPRIIIHSSTPFTYRPDPEHPTSVTEKWRESIFHMTIVSSWSWNATKEEKWEGYQRVSEATGIVRKAIGDGPGAAYLNEADVYQENHEEVFWGTNYERLLEIKKKHDPQSLLDCWHCVGWKKESQRFKCYL
ncbi:FAD-binding domain-containing protein [Marasmius fiardii PR-910]|nr:FAD-binding domain-containing protein [Marasmius fiardii PR-910]